MQLTSNLVEHWIMSNPEASICTPEGVRDFKAIANFQDYHGLPEFRNVSDNNGNFDHITTSYINKLC